MRSATYDLSIGTVRADTPFASALQRSDEPGVAQAGQVIAAAVRAFGIRGCAARAAAGLRRAPGDRGRADALSPRDAHRRVRRGQPRATLPRSRSARRAPHLSRGTGHGGLSPDRRAVHATLSTVLFCRRPSVAWRALVTRAGPG